jgi:hypothetical protein
VKKRTIWHDYNNELRTRSYDFTIWFTEEAIRQWRSAKTRVSDPPSHLPLHQTEGFMNSLARVMKADITIPDFAQAYPDQSTETG